jgi:hypothetical protein
MWDITYLYTGTIPSCAEQCVYPVHDMPSVVGTWDMNPHISNFERALMMHGEVDRDLVFCDPRTVPGFTISLVPPQHQEKWLRRAVATWISLPPDVSIPITESNASVLAHVLTNVKDAGNRLTYDSRDVNTPWMMEFLSSVATATYKHAECDWFQSMVDHITAIPPETPADVLRGIMPCIMRRAHAIPILLSLLEEPSHQDVGIQCMTEMAHGHDGDRSSIHDAVMTWSYDTISKNPSRHSVAVRVGLLAATPSRRSDIKQAYACDRFIRHIMHHVSDRVLQDLREKHFERKFMIANEGYPDRYLEAATYEDISHIMDCSRADGHVLSAGWLPAIIAYENPVWTEQAYAMLTKDTWRTFHETPVTFANEPKIFKGLFMDVLNGPDHHGPIAHAWWTNMVFKRPEWICTLGVRDGSDHAIRAFASSVIHRPMIMRILDTIPDDDVIEAVCSYDTRHPGWYAAMICPWMRHMISYVARQRGERLSVYDHAWALHDIGRTEPRRPHASMLLAMRLSDGSMESSQLMLMCAQRYADHS